MVRSPVWVKFELTKHTALIAEEFIFPYNRQGFNPVITCMKKLCLFPLLVAVLACQAPFCEQGTDQSAGLIVRVLDDRYLAYDVKQGEDLSRNGIQITTPEQYKRVFAYCCENRLDSVDFARFDILGLTTVNRGSSHYLRDVKRDDVAKTITYTVTEQYCKRSSPVDGNSNLVVVPKVPVDYRVEFVRNQ
jgi:hypothetical protein